MDPVGRDAGEVGRPRLVVAIEQRTSPGEEQLGRGASPNAIRPSRVALTGGSAATAARCSSVYASFHRFPVGGTRPDSARNTVVSSAEDVRDPV